jgi:hypothetical protein
MYIYTYTQISHTYVYTHTHMEKGIEREGELYVMSQGSTLGFVRSPVSVRSPRGEVFSVRPSSFCAHFKRLLSRTEPKF